MDVAKNLHGNDPDTPNSTFMVSMGLDDFYGDQSDELPKINELTRKEFLDISYMYLLPSNDMYHVIENFC
jgi:hypothetical protein